MALTSAQIVEWLGHCVVAAVTQVRILVWTGFYFALLMETAFHDGATE